MQMDQEKFAFTAGVTEGMNAGVTATQQLVAMWVSTQPVWLRWLIKGRIAEMLATIDKVKNSQNAAAHAMLGRMAAQSSGEQVHVH